MEESPHDVAALITFAVERGFPRVALVGHSLGVVKATMYQAQRQDPHVAGLAVCSPPLRPH